MTQFFHFTELCYIYPHEKITIDLATFEQIFVTDFQNNKKRKTLFDNYLRYIEMFSKEITPSFTQRINGSFVIMKEEPKDIDFVTFIDVNIYNEKENIIEKFWTTETYNIGLDAYILKIFPENDINFVTFTTLHINKWYERFSFTKENENEIIFPKGFIELNINC